VRFAASSLFFFSFFVLFSLIIAFLLECQLSEGEFQNYSVLLFFPFFFPLLLIPNEPTNENQRFCHLADTSFSLFFLSFPIPQQDADWLMYEIALPPLFSLFPPVSSRGIQVGFFDPAAWSGVYRPRPSFPPFPFFSSLSSRLRGRCPRQ